MTRAQAIRKLRKEVGPKAFFEVRTSAPDKDARAVLSDYVRTLNAERTRLDAALETRRAEVLNADPQYVQLRDARAVVNADLKTTFNRLGYRFTIGVVSELGFGHIEGQGDTWEEAFADRAKRKGQ